MNKVELIGRITREPEIKYTKDNSKMVLNFTIAVDRRYVEQTDFIDCIAWNKTADFISKYFSKGERIGIIGNIQTKNYEDKEGNKRKATEVNVEEAYFIESKKNNNSEEIKEVSAANEGESQEVIWNDDLPF